ncbi:hypothetical protein OE749_01655 [Aestuariibacter sp. AA17]|uniref:Uncharacterized protein n=1 Tax=Fluctibacter corallii TaxID=2984329 RepID=A0ABT3A561_9ALTE|nr:hypothetical protein [Aestuariibacter sp. AA17]MCV2883402.1 hypothetical protein [Aestuariibacter sp. AA17]
MNLSSLKSILGMALLWASTCPMALADSFISSVEIKDQFLLFTTGTPKSHSLPQCVTPDNEQAWAIAINTNTGKNIYALVVMAANTGKKVRVESALDCADVEGVERPLRVRLSM